MDRAGRRRPGNADAQLLSSVGAVGPFFLIESIALFALVFDV
jgi:hypothetical protein